MKKAIKSLVFIFTTILLFNPSCIKAQMFWNQACQFSGITSSYTSVAGSSSSNITAGFSIEAWVNPLLQLCRGIISKGGLPAANLIYGLRLPSGAKNPLAILKGEIQL